jgi:hypothetical protein
VQNSVKLLLLLGAGVGAAAGGLALYVLREPSESPEPQSSVHEDVFPDLDLRAASRGSSVDRIYGTFGKEAPAVENRRRRCIYFRYDRDLFEGALVVLTDANLVEKSWVNEGGGQAWRVFGLTRGIRGPSRLARRGSADAVVIKTCRAVRR